MTFTVKTLTPHPGKAFCGTVAFGKRPAEYVEIELPAWSPSTPEQAATMTPEDLTLEASRLTEQDRPLAARINAALQATADEHAALTTPSPSPTLKIVAGKVA